MIWGIDLGIRSFHAVGLTVETEEQNYADVLGKAPIAYTLSYDLKKGRSRYEELRPISLQMQELVTDSDLVFVEEPPLAGRMNIRVGFQLNQTAGSILSATSAKGYLVPVASWKKAICGNGSADKSFVAGWLGLHHPDLHAQCQGNQNLVDASCIALYGRQLIENAGGIGRVSAGDLDLSI